MGLIKNNPIAESAPLSVIAIGKLAATGAPQSISKRVRKNDATWIIDKSFCFQQRILPRDNGQALQLWMKVPGFFQIQDTQHQLGLDYCCQINSLVSDADDNLSLHTLYDQKSKTFYPILKDTEINTSAKNIADLSPTRLSEIENLFLSEQHTQAANSLFELVDAGCAHPRVLFDLGVVHLSRAQYREARAVFHQAHLMGHPDALEAEWQATNFETQAFRDKYPDIFLSIQRGEPLRALTHLRMLQAEEPILANAALAYCLRTAGEPEEGLTACQAVLEQDPLVSDVYGHLWAFYTQLQNDQAALEVARTHLSLYPLNPQAFTDALDSALLLGDLELARWYTYGYLVNAVNLNTALKNLFKYFEVLREWKPLRGYFDVIIPLLRAPTPEILTYYGEILTELQEHTHALNILNQAMMAAPHEASVVLANGRAIAKAGDIPSAIKFMHTVTNDPNRNDHLPNRYLMLAFLSELYRNNGDLEDALNVWASCPAFDDQLLALVGPRPFVEYAHCLAENEDVVQAMLLYQIVKKGFPDLYITRELGENLAKIIH
ncbi:hypothetical protein OAO01_05960 [Oligoflexia bacterium]|nr:hypothetical protein [Oligoflexia bacterium]